MKKILCLLLAALLIVLSGCSFEAVSEEDFPMYSREDVKLMASSDTFGKGRSDDIYVALDYLYNDSSVAEKCGEDFEICAEDIVCHTSEGQSFFANGIYEGNAEYTVTVEENAYCIKLIKEIDGIWTVTECVAE